MSSYVDKNYSELQKKYSGKYIALVENEIIATGNTAQEVYSKAKLITDNEFTIDYI